MKPPFPFSALVGQDNLKLALLLATVDPSIGGVLLRGERGTAKSTAARALATLMPPRDDGGTSPFVELPMGATEDRVMGSLDLEAALHEGRSRLRPGLLAAADGGVLYIDEVNLLPDHLVDLLLDAAASGRVTVERDGVSATASARFALIGSMNPEEGDLRPQFLDRFGLSVEVRAPADATPRAATIEARLAYEADPAGFVAAQADADQHLRDRLVEARARLPRLILTPELVRQATAVCLQLQLDGLRGDIVLVKAARALAAWEQAAEITLAHVQRAAPFALGHRQRRRPRDPMPPPPSIPPPPPPPAGETNATAPNQQPAPAEPARPVALALPSNPAPTEAGRRAAGQGATGAVIRAIPLQTGGRLAPAPTLTAAATRGAQFADGRVRLQTDDLRQHERRGRQTSRVLFVVDASGSMAAQRRLALAKGAILGLLDSSYQQRDEVGLVIAAGEQAQSLLPFTRQVERAELILRDIPTGGRTPLAHALELAAELCTGETPTWVVLLTDGRANVGPAGGDPWRAALTAAAQLAGLAAGALVIDCESGPVRLERARELAAALNAEIVALDAIDESKLTLRLRNRQTPR